MASIQQLTVLLPYSSSIEYNVATAETPLLMSKLTCQSGEGGKRSHVAVWRGKHPKKKKKSGLKFIIDLFF